MLYQINLPDEIKDADGVLYEPTGEWRCPKRGERFLESDGTANNAVGDFRYVNAIILRPKWHWPAWLKAKCIAMDENGCIWAYRDMPTRASQMWIGGGNTVRWHEALLGPAPPITDWQTPIINPNL
jgi:hypothetical protein